MILYKFKPTSPGVRNKIKVFNNLYKYCPLKKLLGKVVSNNSGRNNKGFITIRHKGCRRKRFYRFIDFFRNKNNILGRIERSEYDPNRKSNISLVLYSDGERRYILSPKNIFIGDLIISGNNVPVKIGNNMFLINIPLGTKIHCVEIFPGSGGKISRSPGTFSTIQSKNMSLICVTLSSGKHVFLDGFCRATIGEVGNYEHQFIKLGKAGSKRKIGVRPTVRGVAMNPVDHPHGGGEGKTSGGRDPVSLWGKLTKSFKKKCPDL